MGLNSCQHSSDNMRRGWLLVYTTSTPPFLLCLTIGNPRSLLLGSCPLPSPATAFIPRGKRGHMVLHGSASLYSVTWGQIQDSTHTKHSNVCLTKHSKFVIWDSYCSWSCYNLNFFSASKFPSLKTLPSLSVRSPFL